MSPSRKAAAIAAPAASAWRPLPRARKIVSFIAASQPISGHARTSSLDTKRTGAVAIST